MRTKSISGWCFFIGLMLILGAAGSSDLGMIDVKTLIAQGVAGLGIMSVDTFGLRIGG